MGEVPERREGRGEGTCSHTRRCARRGTCRLQHSPALRAAGILKIAEHRRVTSCYMPKRGQRASLEVAPPWGMSLGTHG